ncbi:NAD(P)H-hydrate epimerase [Halomicrobium zhouii]|uniref:Bifunctional NAD(P)H-hydrate repair enzyme n=1 Tax=Halomicrobium zhouii TaxID=767519 RepID=A0A1I6LW35_9EURY|nr:NAD(P)H-hydrate dehydratase [Halomicrobium zhouii]SFS07608.1 NAD(P)H-hydrate epimerase [Halomicrobium zhouii]
MITGSRMAVVDENADALGVPRKQLMESSGNAVARVVRQVADPGATITVVAGRGNNGGDAFVAARFLDEFDLEILLLGRAETITTDIARENWDALCQAEYDARAVRDSRSLSLGDPDVVVDAMLGTGISGDLREPAATAAEAVNDSDATVVSVDVPSGFDADTGTLPDSAVDADHVVTFHDSKPGLERLEATVTVADIGIPPAAEEYVGPGDLRRLAGRDRSARVFVIGGGPYTGAPALSAQSALRSGAELSFVAAPDSVAGEIQGYEPDLIVQPYEGERLTPDQVDGLVETATKHDDVVVLGPGLGTADETLDAARRFLESFEGPVVADADALSVVPDVDTEAEVVCTPNSRELAALGGPEVDDLAENAHEVERIADELGHVVLAKGAVDVISDGDRTRLCRAGNPGMAVGGTGDLLSGVVATYLDSQDSFDAACMASFTTGRAGDTLYDDRGTGYVASDVLERIPTALGDATDG